MAEDVRKSMSENSLKKLQCNFNYLVSNRTRISKNKKTALCGCGNKIAVFGLKTGKVLRKLVGHESNILEFYFRTQNPLQVISAAEDGEIIIWDYTDGTIVKRFSLQHPIYCLLVDPKDDDVIYVSKKASDDKNKENKTRGILLFRMNLNVTKKKNKKKFIHETICSVGVDSKMTIISKEGDYVASIKRKKLIIYSQAEKKARKFKQGDEMFTCIAFHPTKLMIATGDEHGRILLWQNFDNGKTPIITELHWHAHAVKDLTFTNDGLYLVSGGTEAVLVTWQLETLKKDFIPRLGAPVKHLSISDDDSLFAISLSNNVVKIISSLDKRLLSSLKGLAVGRCTATPVKYDPRTDNLVLSGFPPGHLQFYDPEQDSVPMIMDVTGQNYLSGIDRKTVNSSEIQHFDLSYDGMWLATVEKGSFSLIPDEVKLKFWHFDVESQRYKQNTVADPPHEDSIVTLKMRPKPEMSIYEQLAVTADCAGKFKIWTLHSDDNEDLSDERTWSCHAVCYYGNGPCGSASFSEDGSLLALVYGNTTTIWDSEIGELKTCLYSPVRNETISDVVFGRGSASAYMMAKTDHYLICWNLLTCSIWWSLEAHVTCLTADKFTGLFAVFAGFAKEKNKLYFFEPSSPKPVGDVSSRHENALSAVFTDRISDVNIKGNPIGMLYFITDHKNVYKVSSQDIQEEDHVEEGSDEPAQSEFEKIFGFNTDKTSEINTSTEIQSKVDGNPSSNLVRKILSTPSHVLPSVTTLCSSFFQSMLLTSKNVESQEEDEVHEQISEMHGDDESSDDDVNDKTQKDTSSEETSGSLSNDKTVTKPTITNKTDKIDFSWISNFVKENYS